MDDKLYDFLLKLPRANLIHLMWSALDEMQHYNGQSRIRAIARTLDARESQSGDKWILPTLRKVREDTDSIGL